MLVKFPDDPKQEEAVNLLPYRILGRMGPPHETQ